MPPYLHGSETKEINVAGRPFTVVLSSVVGLIGIAPVGPVNALTLITSPQDAVNTFGSEVPNFNIPEALAAHFEAGGGVVLVVNTFDSATNTSAVASEAVSVVEGRIKLAFAPLGAVVLQTAGGSPVTLAPGTDYTVNAFGVITIVNRLTLGGYPDGTALTASYTKLNAASVTPAQLIGEVDANNTRTGSYLFELARSLYGFNPKILIAPGFSAIAGIATRLEALATKYRAVALLDAPLGSTMAAVLNGRRPSGPLGGFGSTEERSSLYYPYMQRADPATPSTAGNLSPKKLVPFSAIMAGVISGTDLTLGYWFSPSNKKLAGVTGAEVSLSAAINDPTTDVQVLNAAGVSTYFSGYGTGYLSWGNRSATFPTNTGISSFLSVRRTADIIEETIELNILPFLDQPLNLATIDAVRAGVNGFGNSLIQRGAVIDFSCSFLPEDNPVEQLAAGNPVFSYEFLPPPPMERVTFKALLNTALLRKLIAKG